MKYLILLKYEPFEYPFEFDKKEDAFAFMDTALEHNADKGSEHRGELVIEMKYVPVENTESYTITI